jgi:predicted transposase YbfD/YdcC
MIFPDFARITEGTMAVSSPASIKRHFRKLKDPRLRRRRRHELLDILVIAICAVIGDCDTWEDIGVFAKKREDWFRRFLALPNGVPSADTISRLFSRLDPEAFGACFQSWVRAVSAAVGLPHIAIDGKTLRRSGDRAAGLGPLHLVSAWATEQHLTLGQVAVAGKSNEITAIPKLLELLDLHGALVTIDAMGCQKEIAAQVVAGGGDYVLTVKGNQEHLLEDIQATVEQALDGQLPAAQVDSYTTTERGHGRQEERSYVVVHNVEGIRDRPRWRKLTTVGMCYSERTVNGETGTEVRYFIGSRRLSAKRYGRALRNHWGIENNLHWQLDMTFDEDASRIQERNAAHNFAWLRRIALSLLKQQDSKMSIRGKRKAAALDSAFLEEIACGTVKLENG